MRKREKPTLIGAAYPLDTIALPWKSVSDVYTIPQEHLDFCDTIGQIAHERIAPRSAEIDEKAEYPQDMRELLAEHDILGLPFTTEYGGTGTGTLMLTWRSRRSPRSCASSALMLMVQELGTLPIQLFGTDELKERFLPRCATGEWTPAFALSRARGRARTRRDDHARRAATATSG